MGEPETSHPYRQAQPPKSDAQPPRHVPWIVRVHVLCGDTITTVLLGIFIVCSAMTWASPHQEWDPPNSRGGGIALLIVMTSFALSTLLWKLARRRAIVRRLLTGQVGYARLRDKQTIPDGGHAEGTDAYVMRFSFEHRGKRYDFQTRTDDPEVLEDDPLEQIVFDPVPPVRVSLVDSLPGAPRIRKDNSVAARGHIAGGILALALLTAAAAVQIAGAYYLWLR